LSSLTPREREVAELIGQGLSNRQIATRLVTSVRTAETHVENVLRKLGFSSRARVAAWVASQRREP
jgi:DNA-binding NarL/FixJ family response regulator